MNTTRTIPAVIYAAKSTEDVHGSIPDQLEKATARAVAEGRTVVAAYQDENRSAFSGNRGAGLAAARKHAEQLAEEHGEAELWTLHSDRLARGAGAAPGDAQHLVEILFWGRRARVRLRS